VQLVVAWATSSPRPSTRPDPGFVSRDAPPGDRVYAPRMRRVVTGSRPDGSSFIAHDDELPALAAGASFFSVWEADGAPVLPSDGSPPTSSPAFFPPPGGIRVMMLTLWPGTADAGRGDWRPDPDDARVASIAAGMHVDPAAPGMHRTATVDVELVVAGAVELVLDDGAVTLHAGDWVVQNGTRHTWRNPGDEPCVIAAIFLGATASDEAGSAT
jgi:mannose-6-phosphate isomerase-like protein (cupin superfamily)